MVLEPDSDSTDPTERSQVLDSGGSSAGLAPPAAAPTAVPPGSGRGREFLDHLVWEFFRRRGAEAEWGGRAVSGEPKGEEWED